MNRDDTARLLQARRTLTNEPHGADTVDAWAQALAPWTYAQAHAALIDAARNHARVIVAHLVERLPSATNIYDRPAREKCARCDGTGWELVTAGHADTVKPCACSRGRARQTAFDVAVNENAKLRR
jgi:hypothetical protein